MQATPSSALFQHIADVKTPFALSAFAIAALLTLYATFQKKPHAGSRKLLPVLIAALVLLALAPIAIDAYVQHEKIAASAAAIYRVRVTVVDSSNVPVEDATVRVTASNETKTVPDGSAELSIPRGTLPRDGKLTIYAEKQSAFLQGSKELKLAEDMNPSVIVTVASDRTASLRGTVQDERGHAIPGARVGIAGTIAMSTDSDGNFQIPNAGSLGQKVLLHAEKAGYKPISQYHPAGDDPVVLVLARAR